MRGSRLLVFLLFVFSLAGCGGGTPTPPPQDTRPKIGLLLDRLEHERWHRDRDLFVKRVEELRGTVLVRSGDGDPAKQAAEAEALLGEGVKVLVVVPTDLEKAGAIVTAAAARKVPVRVRDCALPLPFDDRESAVIGPERDPRVCRS